MTLWLDSKQKLRNVNNAAFSVEGNTSTSYKGFFFGPQPSGQAQRNLPCDATALQSSMLSPACLVNQKNIGRWC